MEIVSDTIVNSFEARQGTILSPFQFTFYISDSRPSVIIMIIIIIIMTDLLVLMLFD